MSALVVILPGSFLGFDAAHAAAEELEAFCAKIIELAPLLRNRNLVSTYVNGTFVKTLAECGRYPIPGPLRNALREKDLANVFSAEEIVKLLHRIMQGAITIDDHIGISDSLFDDSSNVVPDGATADECDEIKLDTADLLYKCAICIEMSLFDARTVYFLVPSGDSTAHVEALLLAVEPTEEILIPEEGRKFSADIRCVSLTTSIADLLDPYRLWQEAKGADALHLALSVRAYQFHRQSGGQSTWSEFARHQVGERFQESLNRNAASGSGSHSGLTFETAARVLAGEPRNEAKEFYTPLRADCVRALRTHIHKGGEALRLMYWELADGRLELANVGPKREEEIFHGDPNHAVTLI